MTEYDLKVCKNKAETVGLSAYSLRVQKNTETRLRGITMRKKVTESQRKTEAFNIMQRRGGVGEGGEDEKRTPFFLYLFDKLLE